jgi:copper resistance protein B
MKTLTYNRIWLCIAGAFALTGPAALAGGKDDPFLIMGKLDQFEVRDTEGDDPLVLEGSLWAGYDLNKFWLKAEVERVDNESEELELQALYSRAVSAFWDVQVGIRKDFKPEPDREWGVIGLQGLAPYLFEVDAALFVGGSGRTALRLEAEYEFMFTQRLIMSPEVELNAYGHNDRNIGVGSGLADIEAGLRLRYEIRREFAPYLGVNWSKKYGNTADFAAAHSEDIEDTQFVLGIRAWY